jgi:hypothetical protein
VLQWVWEGTEENYQAEQFGFQPLCQPFLCVLDIFEIRSHELFAPTDFETMILLISASQVARITGVSQWHPTATVGLSRDYYMVSLYWINPRIGQHRTQHFKQIHKQYCHYLPLKRKNFQSRK